MDKNIEDSSFDFAVRIVRMFKHLQKEKSEYILSKQVLRSGTSIGANVREAQFGQSKRDFLAKMSIALKEAHETAYWIELLKATEYLVPEHADSILADCIAIRSVLTAIVKTTRENLEAEISEESTDPRPIY